MVRFLMNGTIARKLQLFLLFNLFVLVMLGSSLSAEEPWGKDASLTRSVVEKPRTVSFSPGLFLICFHQQVLSEADGPRSHFVPSSSEYMRQAILYWGAGPGFVLGCDRLLRENNDRWVYPTKKLRCGYLKWDPVPRPAPSQG